MPAEGNKTSDDIEDKERAKKCRWKSENGRADFYIEHPDYKPDSIAMAVRTLERNMKNALYPNPTSQMLIGRGHMLLGNTAKGMKIMEAALDTFRKNYGTDDIEWALRIYTQSLVEKELSPRTLAICREAKKMSDSVVAKSKANALLGADFQYRTTQVRNDKRQLENTLELEREIDIWQGILALIIVTSVIIFTLMRLHRKNEIINKNKDAIDRLIKERIALNTEIEKLNKRQNELIANNEKTDVVENATDSSAYSEILTMALLTKEDDNRFRLLFDSIFPGYIQKIRHRYAGRTPTAELICMLIRLNKSNDEISLALGIKRESVAKGRYRLRTLFKLDKETDLNEFLTTI